MVDRHTAAGFAEVEQQALQLEAEHRLDEARDAFDLALRLNPAAQAAAEGRARLALSLKEADAARHCSRALEFHNSYPDRQLRMILTVAEELGGAATPLLEEFLQRNPENVAAHEHLADLSAQCGDRDGVGNSYTLALERLGPRKPLLLSYWTTLMRAGRAAEALDSITAHEGLFGGDRDVALLELTIANHAGVHARASRLVDRLDDRPDALLARGQHYLQLGDFATAARLLETVTDTAPPELSASAWALLELAWRATGEPRHEWLVGQPGLYGPQQLALSNAQRDHIAEALRTMHLAQFQPLGQSVRGGTQTAGQLFLRPEPEIGLLKGALADAIRQFVDGMPSYDPKHPLLRHRRDGLAFGPSWSVRLGKGGYHAAHVHPGGVLSSACYIALPETLAGDEDQAGWLELGRPPPELGLDIPPLVTLEPKAGRLVLFPSFLFHGTRPFSDGERLTVAFDLVPVPMDT